jgi:uncharacterized membrane protein
MVSAPSSGGKGKRKCECVCLRSCFSGAAVGLKKHYDSSTVRGRVYGFMFSAFIAITCFSISFSIVSLYLSKGEESVDLVGGRDKYNAYVTAMALMVVGALLTTITFFYLGHLVVSYLIHEHSGIILPQSEREDEKEREMSYPACTCMPANSKTELVFFVVLVAIYTSIFVSLMTTNTTKVDGAKIGIVIVLFAFCLGYMFLVIHFFLLYLSEARPPPHDTFAEMSVSRTRTSVL